jgi:teichuronic acid biosynthesis glycosyltransferase TuaH
LSEVESSKSRPDLIFVSMEDWDDVWRRNQFVCAELARRDPRRKILFVGLPIDVSNRLRRWRLGELRGRDSRTVPGFENITVTHPLKLLPNSIGIARRVNEALFRRHVRAASRRLNLDRPVLWLNPHYAVHLAGRMRERGVVYDITDDWTSLSQSPRLAQLTREQDEELCCRADATIVCSQRLFEMKQGTAKRLHLIPNGVDARHYEQVLDENTPRPPETATWKRPVWGYTGTIHPDRVDVELVEAVARQMRRGTIALVGPDMLSEADRARLLATGRVALTGPVPYAELPKWMSAFDVSITPHRVTPFTESLNPIKLWEYLAAGKPIVSTPVAGFRNYPQWVSLASDAESFVNAAEAVLSEWPTKSQGRQAEAARHSWQLRVDVIEVVLASCGEASGARVGLSNAS